MNLSVNDANGANLAVNDNNNIRLRAGDVVNIGTNDYNDLENKPTIEGTTLQGDLTLEDLKAYTRAQIDALLAYKANLSDLATVATTGDYDDLIDKPEIPTKTSDLDNDSGFVTSDDIPPLVTDLGYIDPEPYEEDVSIYMNTLTNSGFYKFTFGGDDLTYFVAVQSFYMEGSDITLVNQHYWGDEEGPITEYIRAFTLEDDEVVAEWATSYVTMESAVNTFASKSHVHYRTASAALSVWDYCDGSQISFTTDSPILYTDTRTPRHAWLIETTATVSSPNMRFIRLTDLQDASVIYQRSGTYANGVITWGEWEYIGGMKITVNGTSYPITAITTTLVGGVSGVLVDYDDGNSGQLFFADGVGLAAVKSAIESGIPHDTSELTNGAGFLTISDLPIYDGGVQ